MSSRVFKIIRAARHCNNMGVILQQCGKTSNDNGQKSNYDNERRVGKCVSFKRRKLREKLKTQNKEKSKNFKKTEKEFENGYGKSIRGFSYRKNG